MNTATMQHDDITTDVRWTSVCAAEDILPNTGVCALVEGRHVAVFRISAAMQASTGQDQFFAIDNVDPKTGASVLSRGLVGNLGERTVVASPLYKQHYDLRTGECIESPELSVRAHAVELRDGKVWVAGVAAA